MARGDDDREIEGGESESETAASRERERVVFVFILSSPMAFGGGGFPALG